MKQTRELCQALVNLRGNSDFQIFLTALGDDGEQLVQRLIMAANSEGLEVVRGQARQITLIMDTYINAPATLEKLKNQPNRGQQ